MHFIQRLLAEKSSLSPDRQVVFEAERRIFLKRRWRVTVPHGVELGFDLDRRLLDGAVVSHRDGFDDVVRQLPETVYRIPFESPSHAALVSWKTGNLHLPAQIFEDTLLVLDHDAMTRSKC